MDLSERKRRILRAVIEHYIQTAEPVGSKAIVEHAGLDVSSATIRNEMADLEELGLLEQPHTSAGRIPSPFGYRFYVDELMREHTLTLHEMDRINQALRLRMMELDRVIDQVGRVASQITRYPTFALSSGAARVTVRRFDLLMVERNTFIVVVMTDTNVVRNRLLLLPADLSLAQLQLLNNLLNATFAGLTIAQITPELLRTAARTVNDAAGLISLAVSFAMEVLEELEHHMVHTSGVTHLLTHPEYRSLERAKPLMHYLTENNDPGRFPNAENGHVKILIGPENVAEALKDASIVLASYDIGGSMRGVLGVVGPTRMDYAQIAAHLSYMTERLAQFFAQGELPTQKEE